MRVLFVDIDGVLNDPGCWGLRPEHRAIDAGMVARLRALCEAEDAYCVLSSTWRYAYGYERTLTALAVNGWPDVRRRFVGETPVHHDRTRGHEISEWLRENQGATEFAVLDDCTHAPHSEAEAEFAEVAANWVQVDGAFGLQDADVEKARGMLNRRAVAQR
jgi:hypothetical protein